MIFLTKKKTRRSGYLSFCYEVFLTLGSLYQAANANCESFAVTFCASTTGKPQSYGFCFAELSTLLLFALSNLFQALHKDSMQYTPIKVIYWNC